MGKHNIIYLFIFALAFIFCTCDDPVFWAISQEVKPIEPRIKGVPTNFAVYDGRMYVASGNTLYAYNKELDKTYWNEETDTDGNILQIASTGDYLYALCSTDQNNNGKTIIKRFDKDNSSWHRIGGIIEDSSKVHNIFAAGDKLFITAAALTSTANNISYTILYIDNSGPAELITDTDRNDTGELNGAVFDGKSYFLSTKDRGVYKIDDISKGALLINKDTDGNVVDINFSGIINLQDDDNTILLIARDGDVYTVKDTITKIENVSMNNKDKDNRATGALLIWRHPEMPSTRLLLVGRQDSLSYSVSFRFSYGYMELELDTIGIKSGSNFVEPGKNSLSTLIDFERYQTTLGKNPVNYLFQVPPDIDSDMILFASTQKNGVWSCRERNKENRYWNAEE